jgi:hypothetical protein
MSYHKTKLKFEVATFFDFYLKKTFEKDNKQKFVFFLE